MNPDCCFGGELLFPFPSPNRLNAGGLGAEAAVVAAAGEPGATERAPFSCCDGSLAERSDAAGVAVEVAPAVVGELAEVRSAAAPTPTLPVAGAAGSFDGTFEGLSNPKFAWAAPMLPASRSVCLCSLSTRSSKALEVTRASRS